jgi:hypothetical protein
LLRTRGSCAKEDVRAQRHKAAWANEYLSQLIGVYRRPSQITQLGDENRSIFVEK